MKLARKESQKPRILANIPPENESIAVEYLFPNLLRSGVKMTRFTRIALFGLSLFVAAFAAACPERTSIADIEANPSKYLDKEVVVAGTVKDSYGIAIPGTPIRGGAYKIDDGTGSMWVFTEEAVPSKGTQIGVKGRVGSGVNWKGRTYGLGMYENDRKIRKR